MTEENPKVYILMINCKTMLEILGVYSTQEKAYQSYQNVMKQFSGCDNLGSIGIIERELE